MSLFFAKFVTFVTFKNPVGVTLFINSSIGRIERILDLNETIFFMRSFKLTNFSWF